jgi:hypothetical protein
VEITPSLTIARFEQLSPGDLFIFSQDKAFYIALAVEDPLAEEKIAFPLGPALPRGMKYPGLMGPRLDTPTVSFGKDYLFQLPADTRGWTTEPPAPNNYCLVLAGNELYVRADTAMPNRPGFHACYFDLKTGRILSEGQGATGRFTEPRGALTFLVQWAFLTIEKEPRQIVAFTLS